MQALTQMEEGYLEYVINEAKNYKLNGLVLDYKMDTDSSTKGVYLILSPDKAIIDGLKKGEIDLDSQIRLQNSTGGMTYTNFHIFKIEPENIHFIANEAFKHMRDYELLNVCFTEKNLPIPFRIAGSTIEDIKEMNSNRRASGNGAFDEKYEKRYTDYLKRISKISEREDSFKAIYFKNNQEIYSMSEFMKKVSTIESFRLPEESIPRFKEFMKREPNATYYIGDSTKTTSFKIFSGGYSEESKKWVRVSVDATYSDLTCQFSLENLHRLGGDNSTYEKIKECAKDMDDSLSFTYIPYRLKIEEFLDRCNDNKIPFVFDVNGDFGKPGGDYIPIIILAQDKDTVNQIVMDMNFKDINKNKHFIQSFQIGRDYEKENKEKKKKFFPF